MLIHPHWTDIFILLLVIIMLLGGVGLFVLFHVTAWDNKRLRRRIQELEGRAAVPVQRTGPYTAYDTSVDRTIHEKHGGRGVAVE